MREQAGLSGAQMAEALGPGWRQSKISKIETGRQIPTGDEIAAWAAVTNTDPHPLLALHSKATAEYGAWQHRITRAGGAAALQDEIAALEASCAFLAEYQPAMIPGRLQIHAYMREMAAGNEFLAQDGISPDDLSRLIAAKVRRQSILYEPGRQIVHVLGEAALRTRIGDMTTTTMHEQLTHLIDVASLPGHTFAIVPFTAVSPIAPATAFAMYDRHLVIIEALVGDLQITEPALTARYGHWLDRLLETALLGDEAITFCRHVQTELE